MNRTLFFLLLFVNGVATGAFSLLPNVRSDRLLANAALAKTEFPPSLLTALNLSGGGSDVDTASLKREMMAEATGTYLIVQIGCGVVCTATCLGAQVGLWQIAAVWSIAVTLAISTTASISGAHLNPAISFALALLRPSKQFGWGKFLPYVASQVFGAALAGFSNLILFRDAFNDFEATKGIVRGTAESIASASAFGEYWSVSSWQLAFFAEALGTAILAFVIFALTNPMNENTNENPILVPAIIGSTVGALISFLAPLTQAGFNPARDFGPRIVAYFAGWKGIAMKGWWLYVLAPIVGATIGATIADNILYKDKSSNA
jgi:MIP family channel proteins